MRTMMIRTSLALLTVFGAALAAAQEKGDDAKQERATTQRTNDEAVVAAQLPYYPLQTCVVSGEDLGDDAVNVVIGGNLFRTCCERCPNEIETETAKYRGQVERAVVSAQKPLWPLDTCPVSGEPLTGPEADPIDHVHGMRYVKLCCGGCKRKVAKNAESVLAKIDQALIAEQKQSYPLDVCVISGEKLGSMGEPVDRLYGMTLVRLCCKSCVPEFEKAPAKHAKRVRDARIDARRGKDGSKSEKTGGSRKG